MSVHQLRSNARQVIAYPVRSDPLLAVGDAIILLRNGRVTMALRALENVPGLLQETATSLQSLGWLQGYSAGLAAGKEKGHREGFSEGVRSVAPPSRPVADLSRLARLCAAPEGRALVVRVLKIAERDLDAILAGRVRLASTSWQRLWRVVM